ncbi:hypothetical protein [Tistrella mobilis]|uniref:hypothetical protein n=1 Tax=Tistrella mobilis TaxID=171437 RepID=UPI0005A18CC7|nr:hypothetical protein [Tistrella mobilis]
MAAPLVTVSVFDLLATVPPRLTEVALMAERPPPPEITWATRPGAKLPPVWMLPPLRVMETAALPLVPPPVPPR